MPYTWITRVLAFHRYQRQFIRPCVRNSYRVCSTVAAFARPGHASQNINTDFSTLERMWIRNVHPNEISQYLSQKFSSEKNIYSYALSLVSCSIDPSVQKRYDLAFEILLSFGKYLSSNDVSKEDLTIELKKQALETTITIRDKCAMQLLCDTFKLCEDKNRLKTFAEKLLAEERFSDASHCVMLLGLQEEIPIEKILLPLIFRSKFGIVVKYLQGYPELQLSFAKKIDDVIGSTNSDAVLRYGNSRVYVKKLCKYLSKLLRVFDINPENCPNLQRAKGYGSLNFLLKKRFEQNAPDINLDEKIMSICSEPELQKSLLCKLVSMKDLKSAYKFAVVLQVPRDEWPKELLDKEGQLCFDTTPSLAEDTMKTETSKGNEKFLSLELGKSAIKLIASEEEFLACLNDLSVNHKIVGIDSEWKPQRSKSDKARLSLLQLAADDKVFILDLLTLQLMPNHWDKLMASLFSNPDIIKLGCGIMQDVQMLLDNYDGSVDQPIKFSHLVDISFLYEKLAPLYEGEIDDEDMVYSGMKGLSKLCEIVLGKPLNKEVRYCDWEERPLSDSQLEYAALDANCLLQIFETLKSRAMKNNWNFDHYVNVAMVMTSNMAKSVKMKNTLRLSQNHQSFHFSSVVPVEKLKLAVEFQLKDLGMQLRMFGANVKILPEAEDAVDKESLLEAKNEERILICRKTTKERGLDIFPEDKMFAIEDDDLHEKTVAYIFKHFHVKVDRRAILSRCMECNNTEFLNIPASSLQQIWETTMADNESKRLESVPKEYTFSCDDNDEDVHIDTNGFMENGVQIQMDKLKQSAFDEQNVFKVCRTCGHIANQK